MQHSGRDLSLTGATTVTAVQVCVGTKAWHGAAIVLLNGRKTIADISSVLA